MKKNSAKPDPKLHVRKRVAGGASGAVLGAAVAGPGGALVGGALGTLLGDAAEQGTLEIPGGSKGRSQSKEVRSRAGAGTARKGRTASKGRSKSSSKKTSGAKRTPPAKS